MKRYLFIAPLATMLFSTIGCSNKTQITVTFKLNNAKNDVVMKIDNNSII